MREPQEKVIGGHTYQITPLPAMRALRLMPLMTKGVGAMTPDEIEKYARELLATTRVDGKELLPIIDLQLQGEMTVLMDILGFAVEVNFAGPSDAVGHKDGATASNTAP